MAKRSRVRSSVVDDHDREIDQMFDDEEFNPVKKPTLDGMSAKELLESFVEYFAADERQPHECIGTFLDLFGVAKEAQIKKTHSFDRARLEFLRMQIGPVKNFFQTLDNVLVSVSERLAVFEEELLKLKVKEQLRGQYLEWMAEQGAFGTIDQFIVYLKESEEKQSENKKHE